MATSEDGKGLEGAAQAGAGNAKDMADKIRTATEEAVEAAKDALEAAADKVEDVAEDALASAKAALGGAAAAAEAAADKVEDIAGDALASAKAALGDAGAAVAGAAATAGGAARTSMTKMTNLAGKAIGGAGAAAVGAADTVQDATGDALAAAKGALGAAAAGAAGVGAAAAGAATAATVVSTRATGSGGFWAGVRAREEAVRGGGRDEPPRAIGSLDKEPDNLLLWGGIIGGAIAALGVSAAMIMVVGQTPPSPPAPANTENTVFVAPVAPAPATQGGMPTWLASINGSLKEVFSWLGIDFRSNKVLVTGEAPDPASKDAALKQATDLIRAAPDGASVAIIDAITAPGGAAPVGAAFAALGATPDVGACQTAFVETMAGRTINFAVGSAEISADSAAILDALSGVASACQAHAIEIGGHTDKTGDAAANTALSQARADAVKAYWDSRSVPVTAVTAKGYGPEQPLDPADTPEAYAANRRIAFTVSAAP